MENYVERYFAFAVELMQRVVRESGPAIHEAAKVVADAIQHDRLVLLYGSGHSTLIAQDAAGRAGGLVPLLVLQDIANGDAERIEGIAQVIATRYDLRTGGVMIVISNSGINPVPIEMAMLSREAGLKIIAVTALAHSEAVASRHSTGKKLYELADIVIDTHGVRGDAAIDLPGGELKSGATSTVIGAAVLQAVTVQAAAILRDKGIEPPVFVSANVPEGDAHNRDLVAKYRSSLVRFQIPLTTGIPKKPEN